MIYHWKNVIGCLEFNFVAYFGSYWNFSESHWSKQLAAVQAAISWKWIVQNPLINNWNTELMIVNKVNMLTCWQ